MRAALYPSPTPAAPKLVAERGGASAPLRRMLPIRQRLNALPCRLLRAELKAVLIEVCELAENGGRGACDATNRYLAERTGVLRKSLSAAVSQLEARGLLVVEVFAARGNRRAIRPTSACRALYDDSELAPPWQGGPVPTSRKSGNPESRDTYPGKSGHPIPENRDSYPPKSGQLSTTSYEQEMTKDDHDARLIAALAMAEKKAADLEAQLAALKATQPPQAPTPPVAPPPPPPVEQAQTKGPGQQLIDRYSDWYLERVKVRPKITAADAKAAKDLAIYLRGQAKSKDDAGALKGFDYILAAWDGYERFYRKQTKLAQIASNINNLIAGLQEAREALKTDGIRNPTNRPAQPQRSAVAPAHYHTADAGSERKRAFADD